MLAINLSPKVENRLFMLSQTIGVSQDVLAQKAIDQYLANLELVYQLKNQLPNQMTDQAATHPTAKHAKSRAGALAQYANPDLIAQEKSAWGEAMLDKYGTNNDSL